MIKFNLSSGFWVSHRIHTLLSNYQIPNPALLDQLVLLMNKLSDILNL